MDDNNSNENQHFAQSHASSIDNDDVNRSTTATTAANINDNPEVFDDQSDIVMMEGDVELARQLQQEHDQFQTLSFLSELITPPSDITVPKVVDIDLSPEFGVPAYDADSNKRAKFFHILYQHAIVLFNQHRTKREPLLLTLGGVRIDRVQYRAANRWILHLSDRSTIELYTLNLLTDENNNNNSPLTEYNFVWHMNDSNLDHSKEVKLLYNYNTDYSTVWYPTFLIDGQPQWPLASASSPANHSTITEWQAFNAVQPGERFNEHLLFNSDGYAIELDRKAPLFVRDGMVNDPRFQPITTNPYQHQQQQQTALCLTVSDSEPYPSNSVQINPLRFRIFTSKHIQAVHHLVTAELDILPKPLSMPNSNWFSHIHWSLLNEKQMHHLTAANYCTQSTVVDYAQRIFDTIGTFNNEQDDNEHILELYCWYRNGDRLMMDENDYPLFTNLVEELEKTYRIKICLNVRVDMSVPQLVSSYSINQNRYTLDHTNEQAIQHLHESLEKLSQRTGVKWFHLSNWIGDPALARAVVPPSCAQYPRFYLQKWANFANRTDKKAYEVITTSVLYRNQSTPTIHHIGPDIALNSNTDEWIALRQMLKGVLLASCAGYSFQLPPVIGGRFLSRQSKELFIRWTQATIFVPVLHFLTPPWYFDDLLLANVLQYIELHRQQVPLFVELARERFTTGLPIIRPMWYLEPHDMRAFHHGDDQYALGNDLVIAPVLQPDATKRTVYLPSGLWSDAQENLYHGPTVVEVDAPLYVLPYFKRIK